MGGGAPDGWTYVNAHGIAFAVPKDWKTVPAAGLSNGMLAGAVWKQHGDQVGEVQVLSGTKQERPKGVKVKNSADFKLGGKPAAQVSYVYRPSLDGPRLRVLDITARTAQGKPVQVRISGTTSDLTLDTMDRIANSIQVGTIGKGNILKG
ncbi:hypothetical protein GCM10009753_10170 [Streptantibioticus ferralitis]